MRWIEACIETDSAHIDELCDNLASLGVDGMVVEDEADFRDFMENNRQYWDYVDQELVDKFTGISRVKFYLSNDDDGRAVLERISSRLGEKPAVSYVADSDWENNWRQYYKPLEIGQRLVVVPEWENPELGGRVALRLDPGLIFGTGGHATTRMCLCALEKYAGGGKRALDLGCGSGILGIGALLLGCREVMGCDVDPKAPDVALSNARLNGFDEDRFKIYAGDVLSDAGMRNALGRDWDIVMANIVADVIIPLSGMAKDFMTRDGVFICSGIIDGRQDEVAAAIRAAGLEIIRHDCQEDWHCYTCSINYKK